MRYWSQGCARLLVGVDKRKKRASSWSLEEARFVQSDRYSQIMVSYLRYHASDLLGVVVFYKSGGSNDPGNHRGICVSSWLGKLFCSILNQRLLEHVMSLNTLHKSQIGFLPNNRTRTADHVFTLRALIDKYVHNQKQKIYACFVDLKKSF